MHKWKYPWDGIPSTSYAQSGMSEILASVAFMVQPEVVVEIGAQKGRSAVALMHGMPAGSELYVYDLFEPRYQLPPYGETHASFQDVMDALDEASRASQKEEISYEVIRLGGVEAADSHDKVDLLHIDICNHYDNLKPVLLAWHEKVKSTIVLCGGDYTAWLDGKTFRPFGPLLKEEPFHSEWNSLPLWFEPYHGITILRRKA